QSNACKLCGIERICMMPAVMYKGDPAFCIDKKVGGIIHSVGLEDPFVRVGYEVKRSRTATTGIDLCCGRMEEYHGFQPKSIERPIVLYKTFQVQIAHRARRGAVELEQDRPSAKYREVNLPAAGCLSCKSRRIRTNPESHEPSPSARGPNSVD